MTTNTDAMQTQTLDEQAATLQRVYDLVGMGALARTPGILLANLENMKRRSDCLSGIEQLFTYEVPDDDMPDEMVDECDLNWGHDRAEYVEAFKAALPAFIGRNPELALLSASKPAAPEGWKLVPVEPTEGMMNAFQCASTKEYQDMLAAAPAAPAQSGEWDAYRLKVAEDCNERLMSACSDAGCPDGVNMADWIRGLGMLAPSCVAPAPDKRLPSREEIQNLRDHGHGEEAAYWEEALRKAAPQPSQPAQSGEAVAWESTTPAYRRFITDSRYQKLSQQARKWYKPYRCHHCAAPQPSQPAQSGVPLDDELKLGVSVLARLSAQIFDCPLNPTISKFARAVEANVRAASQQPVEQTAGYRDFNEFWSMNWGDFPHTEEADARHIWEVATESKNGGSHD